MAKGSGKERDRPEPAGTSAGSGSARRPGVSVTVSEPILGFDRVWFTNHSLVRMKERGVSQEDVFSVLRSPDLRGLPTERGRKRCDKSRPYRGDLDVVFIQYSDCPCVITVIVL